MKSKFVTLAVLLLFVSSVHAAPRLRANGKIAFSSDRDGNREIYVMNPDGTNQVRLTNYAGLDDNPVWSPDGKKIAFVSQKPSGEYAIYRMNADGTGRTEITTVSTSQNVATWRPFSWSPDGRKIAFQDADVGGIYIFVINADGTDRRNLTAAHSSAAYNPTWSPDGSKIMFSRGDIYAPSGYGGTMLHTINADGTGLTRLKNGFLNGWNEDMANWSPVTNKIVYSVNVWDFQLSLFISDPDGENRQLLEEQQGIDHLNPTWSPDGRWIVYSRDDAFNTYSVIRVRDVNSAITNTLTTPAQGKNYNPSWQSLPRIMAGSGQGDN